MFICVCGMHECVFTLTCAKGSVWYCSLPYTLKLFLNIGLAVLTCLVSQLAPGSLGSVWDVCLGMTGTHHAHLTFP